MQLKQKTWPQVILTGLKRAFSANQYMRSQTFEDVAYLATEQATGLCSWREHVFLLWLRHHAFVKSILLYRRLRFVEVCKLRAYLQFALSRKDEGAMR